MVERMFHDRCSGEPGRDPQPHSAETAWYNVLKGPWQRGENSVQDHQDHQDPEKRPALSRQRVLAGAVAVADEGGVAALTIRSLAAHLGVKPMSLYYYVANKSEIFDAIVDGVFSEISLPTVDGDWRVRDPSPAPPPPATYSAVTPGRSAPGITHLTRSSHPATPRRHDRHLTRRRILR